MKNIIAKAVCQLLSRYPSLPLGAVKQPVFIAGCGRSGTTIFGTALSFHPQITFLNEARDLWISCYPMADIWSIRAKDRGGKLVMTRDDIAQGSSQKLRRLFRLETLKTRRPILVEKLPINNFRLPFIYEIFPDARFIHIVRNGREVAKSIAKEANERGWFGINDYKWRLLAEYAKQQNATAGLPQLCENHYERGLLEWRLGTEAVHLFFQQLPGESFFEISYDDLVNNPVKTIHQVLAFMGLEKSNAVDDFVRQNIARRSPTADSAAMTEKERLIGGKLLAKFI
jgi:hypothetical protein